jgi:hypothetical protein
MIIMNNDRPISSPTLAEQEIRLKASTYLKTFFNTFFNGFVLNYKAYLLYLKKNII